MIIVDVFETREVMDLPKFCALPLKKRADILLVDTETLLQHPDKQESFRAIINTFLGVVFFHDQKNQKAQEWVEREAAFLTKIVGEYALPMAQLQWTMLSNQLQFFWSILEEQKTLQKKLARFSQDLDLLMQKAEVEMDRARRVHETLVPKRSEEIKGISFQTRYATGDGAAGEFHDLIETTNSTYFILASSESYLISGALMSILDTEKSKNFNPMKFLKIAEAEAETVNASKKKKAKVDIAILEVDYSKMMLRLHGSDQIGVYSPSKGKIELDGEYALSRNEKIIVFSPGFLFNWKETHPSVEIGTYLKGIKASPSELLPELFYELKLDEESQYMKKDATAMMMEVKRYGIREV
jgi:hypothetical protein